MEVQMKNAYVIVVYCAPDVVERLAELFERVEEASWLAPGHWVIHVREEDDEDQT